MPFARMDFVPTWKEVFSVPAMKALLWQLLEILALTSMNVLSFPMLVAMALASIPLVHIGAGAIMDLE